MTLVNCAVASVEPSDNANSVGLLFTYGKFRHINLGDFTWNAEKELMCPNNPIGNVDLYITSHHGIEDGMVHCAHFLPAYEWPARRIDSTHVVPVLGQHLSVDPRVAGVAS